MEFNDWKELLIKHVEEAMQANPEWRYGQAVFNVMDNMGLGGHIRTTHLDCFYFRPEQLDAVWSGRSE